MLRSEWSDFRIELRPVPPCARACGRRSHGYAARLIVALGFALIRRGSRGGKSTVGRDCRELLIKDPPLRGKGWSKVVMPEKWKMLMDAKTDRCIQLASGFLILAEKELLAFIRGR